MNNFKELSKIERLREVNNSQKSLWVTRLVFMFFSVFFIGGGTYFELYGFVEQLDSDSLQLGKETIFLAILTFSIITGVLVGAGELYSSGAIINALNNQNRLTHVGYFLISVFLSFYLTHKFVSSLYKPTAIQSVVVAKQVSGSRAILEEEIVRLEKKLDDDNELFKSLKNRNFKLKHLNAQQAVIEVTGRQLSIAREKLVELIKQDEARDRARLAETKMLVSGQNDEYSQDTFAFAFGVASVMFFLALLYGLMSRTKFEKIRLGIIENEFEKIEEEVKEPEKLHDYRPSGKAKEIFEYIMRVYEEGEQTSLKDIERNGYNRPTISKVLNDGEKYGYFHKPNGTHWHLKKKKDIEKVG